jgi:hypothetical protein
MPCFVFLELAISAHPIDWWNMMLGIMTGTLSSILTGLFLSLISSNLCSFAEVNEKHEIGDSHDSGYEDGCLQGCGC